MTEMNVRNPGTKNTPTREQYPNIAAMVIIEESEIDARVTKDDMADPKNRPVRIIVTSMARIAVAMNADADVTLMSYDTAASPVT